jgi:hypothetical protein
MVTRIGLGTALGDLLLSRRGDPARLARSPGDVYLAPHCDDVAFSIGNFARARGTGVLLTVFGTSEFVVRPERGSLSTEAVTMLRQAEDREFAVACGLDLHNLDLPEAPLRGREPMAGELAEQDVPAFTAAILAALLRAAPAGPEAGKPRRNRPWLFAPMAIGGHIDHTIVLYILAQNRQAVEAHFRLAFYEDLPYAAHYHYRMEGLARFRARFGRFGWRRLVLPLGGDLAGKLALIGLYRSQHPDEPADIAPFTPKCRFPTAPHEAIWVQGAIWARLRAALGWNRW